MICNIIIKENSNDNFTIQENEKNKVFYISSYKHFDLRDEQYVSHSILNNLSKNKLNPSENSIDFINLSLGVYVFDQLVSRKVYGYYSWNRYFKVYLPVAEIEKWNNIKKHIEQFLSFLSGDKWKLYFRKRELIYENYKREVNNVEKVCLLSGGLDSFIGATDLLEEGIKEIAFVSHYKMGNTGDKSTQEELIKLLQNEFSDSIIHANNFYVQSKIKDGILDGESSQRARSIIVIALGLAVANSYSNEIPIVIPENGLISLNVPLTKTRLGSHSTKTTHPYFIESINILFEKLGIKNLLYNPYRFYTKGEMLIRSKKSNFIKSHVLKTISCSKGGLYIQRFHRNEKHCGHCTPCIIRRAALKKANIDLFKGNYVKNVCFDTFNAYDKSSRDLIAFKIGITRLINTKKNLIFELLKSGPIPASTEELYEYKEVYRRGIDEVREFLFNQKIVNEPD